MIKISKKATGVEVLDSETNKTYEFHSKIVFLNASTLNSAWVLMNSATDVWPEGLAAAAAKLGHNIMDHHYMLGAQGTVDGYEEKYYYGRRRMVFIYRDLRTCHGDKRNFLRGYGYQGSASREGWSRQIAEMNIGAEFRKH